jgi:hypothetical protein
VNHAKSALLIALVTLAVSLTAQTFAALSLSVTIPSSGPITTNAPWLHTSGQNIYDDNKQVKIYACVIQDGCGNHLTQADLQKIKNMGFNAIRLFIEWGTVQPTANTINTAYFTQASGSNTIGAGVDYVVNWAYQLGMYVVICPFWSDSWTPPSWATGVSSSTGDAHALLYNTQVQSGVNFMYNWMAQHYSSNSNVIFESFNEISTTTDSDATAFANFNSGWISAIESGEGANSHLKIVQVLYHWGDEYNYVFSGPYVSGTHTNVMLATHDYPLVDSSPQTCISFANYFANTIHDAGYPWIDTEFSTAMGGTYDTLQTATTLMADRNVSGWMYYCYDSNAAHEGNWNINNPSNSASLLPILQSAMVQP